MNRLKTLTLLSLIFLAFGCKNEQPTLYSLPDKYTIQNDTNWVEITDTISIDLGGKNKSGILLEPPNLLEYDKLYQINNQFDYQELLQELDSVGILKPNPPSIDFEQKTLLCYYQISGNHNSTSRLFKNNSTKEYLLLINIHLFDHFLAPHIVREWLLVPKIEANYNILIDTLMQY